MAVSLRIHFDRPDAVYFAGETVTGRVVMDVARAKKVRAVSIQLRGAASLMWTETSSSTTTNSDGSTKSDDTTTTYSASETYFDNRVYFLGGATGGEVDISAGHHEYNFECLLPRNVPSSFEGEHGSVRYTATAAMNRPWKFDHTAKAAFTVITHLDLNGWPQAKEPVSAGETKHFCCGWCKSGPLSVDVHLPSGGFVPGQAIVGQVQVDNGSTVRVERVVCSLEKEVKWHASGGKTNVTRKAVASTMFSGVVETHASKVISLVIPVPAVPPSNLFNCNIIDLSYYLRVTAEVSGIRLNLHCLVPVLVGTIPVFVQDGWNRAGPPDAPPSAPPMYPGELPPPTYEESVLRGNSIMDATETYTMGQKDFTPRYPVWAFNNASFEK